MPWLEILMLAIGVALLVASDLRPARRLNSASAGRVRHPSARPPRTPSRNLKSNFRL